MDAKKAQDLTLAAKSIGVSDVEMAVEIRASEGFSDLNWYKNLNQFQIAKLKDKGFDVSGPYGGAHGSHLWIKW